MAQVTLAYLVQKASKDALDNLAMVEEMETQGLRGMQVSKPSFKASKQQYAALLRHVFFWGN